MLKDGGCFQGVRPPLALDSCVGINFCKMLVHYEIDCVRLGKINSIWWFCTVLVVEDNSLCCVIYPSIFQTPCYRRVVVVPYLI